MQSFGDLFANNRLLALGLLLAAVAVILAVGIGLFRLTFGRRLHMSGGRTRQPRLGVVDAFDLDRQRQLVIVRRDNVEHLLMIGGPNDVLIEAAIVRAPVSLTTRDKDNGVLPMVSIPAPTVAAASVPGAGPTEVPSLPSTGGGDVPFPAGIAAAVPPPEPQVVAAANERDRGAVEPVPPVLPPVAPPASEARLPTASTLPSGSRPMPQRTPASAMPPRPPVAPVPTRPAATPSPRPNFSRATPVVPPPSTGQQPAARVEPVVNRPAPGVPPIESNREEPVSAPQVSAAEPRADERGGPSPGGAPSVSPAPTSPSPLPPRPAAQPRPVAPPPPRPQIVRTPAPAQPAPRAPVPSLGSLEEEMAKLLGRPMPPPDQSNGS